jgi:hypothetical protein
MKAFRPVSYELPVSIIREVDLNKVIGNVLTAMLSCNNRPGMYRAIGMDTLKEWNTIAMAQLAEPSQAQEIMRLWSKDAKEFFRTPQMMFLDKWRAVISHLLCPPSDVRNVGEAMVADLSKADLITTEHVAMAAFGYPRPWYSLAANAPTYGIPYTIPVPAKLMSGAWAESLAGVSENAMDFASNYALVLKALDRPGFSDQLIPEIGRVDGKDARAPLWGNVKASGRQDQYMIAIDLLYLFQAAALYLQLHSELRAYGGVKARESFPREQPALDMFDQIISRTQAEIPTHPLSVTVASLLANYTISTRFGVRPCMLRHGPSEASAELTRNGRRIFTTVGETHMAFAYGAVTRLQALAARGVLWPEMIVEDFAPDVSPTLRGAAVKRTEGMASIGELLEELARLKDYTDLWPEITGKLGWQSPVRFAGGEMEAAAADWVLTSGDSMSADPLTVLAGLRPALVACNPRALGFELRADTHFNTGPRARDVVPALQDEGVTQPLWIEWSPMTAMGHRSANEVEAAIAKFYIPEGMWMGEDGDDPRYADPECSDMIQASVQAYYRTRSPKGYIRTGALPPGSAISRNGGTVTLMLTSWDPIAETASDVQGAQSMLLGLYGPANLDTAVERFRFRKEGWPIRFPVRISRTPAFEILDERGNFIGTGQDDGWVVYDDVLDLPHSIAPIEQIVNLMRVDPPQFADPRVEEAKPPVETSGL